jgi:hypothetical protein
MGVHQAHDAAGNANLQHLRVPRYRVAGSVPERHDVVCSHRKGGQDRDAQVSSTAVGLDAESRAGHARPHRGPVERRAQDVCRLRDPIRSGQPACAIWNPVFLQADDGGIQPPDDPGYVVRLALCVGTAVQVQAGYRECVDAPRLHPREGRHQGRSRSRSRPSRMRSSPNSNSVWSSHQPIVESGSS